MPFKYAIIYVDIYHTRPIQGSLFCIISIIIIWYRSSVIESKKFDS